MIGEGTIFTAMIGAMGVLLILLGVAGLILWIVLPFSVFGIKGLIKEAIGEQKRTNELLREILYRYEGEEGKSVVMEGDEGLRRDP